MRHKFGDAFYLEDRSRKHRYVFFVGNKAEKKKMRNSLMYQEMPYPKGETCKYDSGGTVITQSILQF